MSNMIEEHESNLFRKRIRLESKIGFRCLRSTFGVFIEFWIFILYNTILYQNFLRSLFHHIFIIFTLLFQKAKNAKAWNMLEVHSEVQLNFLKMKKINFAMHILIRVSYNAWIPITYVPKWRKSKAMSICHQHSNLYELFYQNPKF